MKRYTTDWKTIIIAFSIGGILFIIGLYNSFNFRVWLQGSLLFGIFIVTLILLSTKYSYAAIFNTTLKFVYLLFYRKIINIHDITEISDQPTYKVGKNSFRSVYIFYKTRDKGIQNIELRITIFPEKTIGLLIYDLKQINPTIQLNKYCERLMSKATNN